MAPTAPKAYAGARGDLHVGVGDRPDGGDELASPLWSGLPPHGSRSRELATTSFSSSALTFRLVDPALTTTTEVIGRRAAAAPRLRSAPRAGAAYLPGRELARRLTRSRPRRIVLLAGRAAASLPAGAGAWDWRAPRRAAADARTRCLLPAVHPPRPSQSSLWRTQPDHRLWLAGYVAAITGIVLITPDPLDRGVEGNGRFFLRNGVAWAAHECRLAGRSLGFGLLLRGWRNVRGLFAPRREASEPDGAESVAPCRWQCLMPVRFPA